MTRSGNRRRWAAVWLVLVLAASGCADRDASTRREASRPSASAAGSAGPQAVDPSLFAFLSKARAAHHQADLAETKGDTAGAIAFLDAIVSGPRPKRGPETDEVLADAHARLADLKSGQGQFDDAQKNVALGLELASQTTHFRGHLFEMKGIVEERRMKALKEQGDDTGAEKAKRAALEAFEKAIEIQDAVIEKALDGAPSAVPTASASASPSAVPR